MCCFSGRVARVEGTRIFARFVAPARQVLAYQMRVAAPTEVAMILPVPVPARSAEDAVRFVSLEGYPELFDHLERAFPPPVVAGPPGAVSGGFPQSASLVVHQVGAFVASFVPTASDFARVDPRFRLPAAALDAVADYARWGFAVFQLRDVAGAAPAKVHPMAFEFPTARPHLLFFPTLHVHDGTAPARARFDHVLYAQGAAGAPMTSPSPLGATVDASRAVGLIDGDAHGQRLPIVGDAPNRDTWMPRAST